jgi:PleD family two-component response regulator
LLVNAADAMPAGGDLVLKTRNVCPAARAAFNRPETSSKARIEKWEGVVLLVEDEEMVLQVNAQMLRRLGYTVIEAGEGCAAVDLFKKNGAEIDLVVLDMIMPGMGVVTCSSRLKN